MAAKAASMLPNFWALLAHERNQQGALQRATQAQAQGLDPAPFAAPFPGANIVTTTTNNTGGGLVKGALLAATLAAAGGAATWGLMGQPTSNNKSEIKAPAVSPVTGKATEYDAVYEEKQADGTWKETKRERLRTYK